MDKINSDNFVEMNAYTLEHRILVTGNTKANWEKENGFNCPSIVVDPKSATLQDIFDAQDFGLAHPGATWEDYLAYLLIPRLTS